MKATAMNISFFIGQPATAKPFRPARQKEPCELQCDNTLHLKEYHASCRKYMQAAPNDISKLLWSARYDDAMETCKTKKNRVSSWLMTYSTLRQCQVIFSKYIGRSASMKSLRPVTREEQSVLVHVY